jgi:hypothetical protein
MTTAPGTRRPAPSPRRGSDWLAGLTVGAAAGLLVAISPVFGIALALAFVVGAARTRSGAGVAGILVGLPAIWLIAVGVATLACQRFDAGAGQECRAPDLTAWALIALGLLVAGLVGSVAVSRRRVLPDAG